nr:uncharacterized mitochondrial protein AtMg00810-like [Tanacetum cinerariifolium]
MSSMGELTLFLGLKVKQKDDMIFISQDKYVAKILRKFGFTDVKSASTPIKTEKPLLKDPDGEDVDVHIYMSMIGSLMYLTSPRPDIMYLKGKPQLGLWYPRDSHFNLVALSDSDYAGASLDRKSTTGGANTPRSDEDRLELMELTVFLLPKVEKVGIGVNAVDLQVNDVTRLQALLDKKNVVITEATIRDTLHLDDAEGVDCLLNEEIFKELARIGYEKPSTKLTFDKAFFSSQCIYKYEESRKGFSRVETPLFEGMLVEQHGDVKGDADEHVEEVNIGDAAEGDDSAAHGEVPTIAEEQSIPSPTPPSSSLQPPQDIPSTSQVRVEHLEYDKVAQALEITKLKRRVKKLKKRNKDDAVVLKDDKEENREVADAVKMLKRLSMQEDETKPSEVQKVVDVVTIAKLITEVVTATSETVTASSAIITTAEAQVPAATTAILIAAPARVATAPSRKKGKE